MNHHWTQQGRTAVWLAGFSVGVLGAGDATAQNYHSRTQQARSALAPTSQHPQSRAAGVTGYLPAAAGALSRGVNSTYTTRPRPLAGAWSLTGLRQAMTSFYLDMGRLPKGSEGLGSLLAAPPGAVNWRGPYITVTSGRSPFADPWGNMYRYLPTNYGNRPGFIIKSNGPDGRPDTADDLSVSG